MIVLKMIFAILQLESSHRSQQSSHNARAETTLSASYCHQLVSADPATQTTKQIKSGIKVVQTNLIQ